MEHIYKC